MYLNKLLDSASYVKMEQAGTDGAAEGSSAGAPASVTTNAGQNNSAAATVSTTVGDAAKASQLQSSVSATVAQPVGREAKGSAPDFRDGWTDDLKKDPYLSGFRDSASLAKALIDNKKLIGQKLGIPGADATPEAKAAFYEAMGVPKEPGGYEFKQPDKLPESMKGFYNQEHADKWAKRFHDLGIPKEAANVLRNELFSEITAELGNINTEVEKSDKQFSEMAVKIFGDNKKADTALQATRTIIEKHLPPELKSALGNLPNSALLAVAAAIDGERKVMGGEDKTLTGDQGLSGDGKTMAQLRQEAQELMNHPDYASPFGPGGKIGHNNVTKRVNDIYKRIGGMA